MTRAQDIAAEIRTMPKLTQVALLVMVAAGLGVTLTLTGGFDTPTITGAVVVDGHVLIEGGGWGDVGDFIFDDFDGQQGERVGEPWYTVAARSGSEPSYEQRDGRGVARHHFTNGNYNSTLGLVHLARSDRFVAGEFFNTTEGAASRNVKPFAMRGGGAGAMDDPELRADCYPATGGGHIYAMSQDGYLIGQSWSLGNDLHSGAWTRMDVWADMDSCYVVDFGERHAEVNAALLTGDEHFTNLYMMHYFATDAGDPRPQMVWDWDWVWTSTTRARVEAGDAPVLEDCTYRRVLGVVDWGDLIDVALPDDERLRYVFVVDESGRVSNGWEM